MNIFETNETLKKKRSVCAPGHRSRNNVSLHTGSICHHVPFVNAANSGHIRIGIIYPRLPEITADC